MSDSQRESVDLLRENEALRRRIAALESNGHHTKESRDAKERRHLDRRESERSLAASEKQYRRLFESAKDGILILDAGTGEIVDANPFVLELTGYSYDDFLGKHLWEIGAFKDVAASRESFAKLQTEKYVRYEDLPLKARDGRIVDVEFVSNVYMVDDWNVIQCNIRDISARKRAEKQILEQGATLSAILESADSPIYSVDREYRYTSFNRAHAAAMKAALDVDIQLSGSMARYHTSPEDWRASREIIDRALLGESVLHSKSLGAEGLLRRHFEVAHHPIRTNAGEILGVSVFAREVTARRRMEDELLFRNLILSTQQEASIDGILVVDVYGTVVSSNRRFVDMWNIPPQIMASKSDERVQRSLLAKLVNPDEFVSKVGYLYATPNERSQDEIALIDGRTFDRYSAPMLDADGRHFGRVWYFRDITERKQAEAVRERLTTAIEQAAEMVLVTDAEGAIVYVNPAFETGTGYSRAEVLGQNPRLLKSGAQDDSFYPALWTTISTGHTWRGRLVNKRKDGTHYTEEASISPVRDADGVITSYVAVKRDITQELALQAQFLHAQKMEGIGRLAGGVAHDFNNLLSVILSYTEFAVDELSEGDPLRDDLLEVKKAGEHAVLLTRQLLAFSRKQILRPVPLDVNQVLAEMEKMLSRIIGEDVDLVRALAPDLGLVKADLSQLEQVIMNLAVNARDAMPEGGKLTIETANAEFDEEYAARHAAVAPGPYVMLAVTDSGVGMDEPTMARLFEPFFTTKELGRGTGFGLSTVYGIVKQSGGSIFVYSEVGSGTTFKIYLPRELSGTATAAMSKISGPVTGTETILVVEDEDALRRVTRRILETAGYTVLTAANGGEALLVSARHAGEIHLLLTDVVMPGMNGGALASELAETRPKFKVLYMSGYTDNAIVHHGVLDAGTYFLGKPFSTATLTRKVREVLDGETVGVLGEFAQPN